jgi:hypothetical protein
MEMPTPYSQTHYFVDLLVQNLSGRKPYSNDFAYPGYLMSIHKQ